MNTNKKIAIEKKDQLLQELNDSLDPEFKKILNHLFHLTGSDSDSVYSNANKAEKFYNSLSEEIKIQIDQYEKAKRIICEQYFLSTISTNK